MIEFGKTLRTAREAKGYTITQLGDITHLPPTTIDDLENENFSRIAAPIYGRGFIKLYCAAVGLEVKPMVDEFMDIFQGNRAATIRELPDTTEQEPKDSPLPIPNPPEPEVETPPVANPLPIQQTFDNAQPMPSSTLPPIPESTIPQQQDVEPTVSRYAAPLRIPHEIQISPKIWRIALLAVVGLGFLILLVFGIRALYHATDPRAEMPSESQLPDPSPAATTTPAEAAVPRAPRTPIPVPPLYVD